jgi:hypothetical protein
MKKDLRMSCTFCWVNQFKCLHGCVLKEECTVFVTILDQIPHKHELVKRNLQYKVQLFSAIMNLQYIRFIL